MINFSFTKGRLNALPILAEYESQRRNLETAIFNICRGHGLTNHWREVRSTYVDNYGRLSDDTSSIFYLRNYDPREMEIELGVDFRQTDQEGYL